MPSSRNREVRRQCGNNSSFFCAACEGANSLGAWAVAFNKRHSQLGEPSLCLQFAAEGLISLLDSAHDPLEVPLLGESALQQSQSRGHRETSLLSYHEGPFPTRTRGSPFLSISLQSRVSVKSAWALCSCCVTPQKSAWQPFCISSLTSILQLACGSMS